MSFVPSPAVVSTDEPAPDARRIGTALLSAHDKTGVVELARALQRHGAVIVASGGTAEALRGASVPVRSVEELTGLAPGFGGRVKTLHPKIHAGILARRDVAADLDELERAGVAAIDLVYVNLYPFEEAVRRGASPEERIETIDVGGPAMLRAAAKNWKSVAALCDPAQIEEVVRELDAGEGRLGASTRRRLAQAVFARTAAYDRAIAADLGDESRAGADQGAAFPGRIDLALTKVEDLRYGENPHQRASLYAIAAGGTPGGSAGLGNGWEKIGGDELSYNNWVDLAAAAELAFALPASMPAAVIVKHTNPCGAAAAPTLLQAWERALATDPVSAFGGIAAFNVEVDGATAQAMASLFLEIVVAPAFSREALARFAKKPKLRIVRADPTMIRSPRREWRTLPGSLALAQDGAGDPAGRSGWRVVSRRVPETRELEDLEFAWIVASRVKSNAIVFAKGARLLGVGAGQMSRVDSVRIAVEKAREHGHDLTGSVVASDAFFPFADGPKAALAAGAVAIAQPGGSKRDAETIEAVDAAKAAMVFTGRRTFLH